MNTYLEYPMRRLGMDHELYEWEPLPNRAPAAWSSGGTVALAVVIDLEFFRLDRPVTPVQPHSAPTKEYPDYREWTVRDFGTHVGIYRILELLRDVGVRPTAAVNSEILTRYPAIVDALAETEVVGHGTTASLPLHPGLSLDEERELIRAALATVRGATGQVVRGWLSPSMFATENTLRILAEEGVDHVLDFVNDDYPLDVAHGLVAVPGPWELSDVNVIATMNHSSEEFAREILDAATFLSRESQAGGARVITVGVRPWLMGQAHRAGDLRDALTAALALPGVRPATVGEIADAYRAARG